MHATGSIFDHFKGLSDPRVNRGNNHSLYEMVVIALTAAICGANGWVDVERFGVAKIDWFKKFLILEHGIPSHDTFGRVFALLNTDEFLTCLQNWIQTLHLDMKGQGVAIDGKTLRGSHDRSNGGSAIHMASAWASEVRLVLGQLKTDDKSNEITAIPEVIKTLSLQGAIITIDAMGCQKKITQ